MKKFLTKLQPEVFYKQNKSAHFPRKGDSMKCTICGRRLHVLNNGKGPLICCGKPMKKDTLPANEGKQMIHDEIRKALISESMGAVMGCRAAKSSIPVLQKRAMQATDPVKKAMLQKSVAKKKLQVAKCKQKGLMI